MGFLFKITVKTHFCSWFSVQLLLHSDDAAMVVGRELPGGTVIESLKENARGNALEDMPSSPAP